MSVSRRRLPKVKRGDLLEIVFLDHACTVGGLSSPILCRAIGELVNEDKQAYYLASWMTEENDVTNLDSHTVLKSTIKTIVKIRSKKR
ncbi:MAG: hypothetical protein EBZ49_00120 [Proteobacteria bacterium]|nr:hypothetical protein [Pseudomonadota bacterium]